MAPEQRSRDRPELKPGNDGSTYHADVCDNGSTFRGEKVPSFLVSCKAYLAGRNEVAFSAAKAAMRRYDSGVFEWS